MQYWKKISIWLLLVFGLVGIERGTLGYIAPLIIDEFKLSYTQFGLAMAIFAMTWGIGSLSSGLISDRYGKKTIIIVATLFAACFGWITGMVRSLSQLVGVRGIMGLGEGATFAPVAASVTEQSPPHMRAKMAALLPSSFIVLGFILGPILGTQLAQIFGWRPTFYIISVPGAIVALVIWKIMKEPPRKKAPFTMGEGLRTVIKNRNVFLCLLISIFSMARLYIFTTFLVLYITKIHGYSLSITGLIFGISSVGDILGAITMGAISDKIQKRRIIMILCSGLCCLFIIVLSLIPKGMPMPMFILVLFFGIFFSGGMSPFYLILIPAESVGPDLAGSAIGITNATGEFLGAGILPIFAGVMGDLFGLRYTMLVAALVMGLSAIFGLFLKKVPHERFEQRTVAQEV